MFLPSLYTADNEPGKQKDERKRSGKKRVSKINQIN